MIAALWKFLGPAQELQLLAIVNAKYVSNTLVAVFEGSAFLNFNVFSFLFSLLPPEYQGQVGYNALMDNAQYHPNIFPIFLSVALTRSYRDFLITGDLS